MPKLNNRPPKYSKMGKYAVAYYGGKPHYLGRYGSPESKVAYSRLLAEIQANPSVPLPSGEKKITVRELAAAFLDYAKASTNPTDYAHYRTIVLDFLDKLYGDSTPVENFTPRSLKLVRDEMIKSRRFCRNIVNKYTVDGMKLYFANLALLCVFAVKFSFFLTAKFARECAKDAKKTSNFSPFTV